MEELVFWEKLSFILIGVFVAILVWYIKKSITRFFNSKDEEKEFKLKILEELYSDVTFILELPIEPCPVQSKKSKEVIGKIGFRMRVYFPEIFENEWTTFFEKRTEIYLESVGINFTQNFPLFIQKIKELSDASNPLFSALVKEAKEYKKFY